MTEVIPAMIDNTTQSLNHMLELELAAAATYESAQTHIENAKTNAALELNRQTHVSRAWRLGKMVRDRGAKPSQSGQPWLAISKVAEKGASMFGDDAILKTLIEGEKALNNRMHDSLAKMDVFTRQQVQEQIVADQAQAIGRVADIAEVS